MWVTTIRYEFLFPYFTRVSVSQTVNLGGIWGNWGEVGLREKRFKIMSKQLHKNFTDSQVKSLLKSYIDKEIKFVYILRLLYRPANHYQIKAD